MKTLLRGEIPSDRELVFIGLKLFGIGLALVSLGALLDGADALNRVRSR